MTMKNLKEESEKIGVVLLKYAAGKMGDELGWFIDDYVYEEVEEKDEKGHTYTKRQRIVERDSLSIKSSQGRNY